MAQITGKMNTTQMSFYVGASALSHCTDASISFAMNARDVTTKDSAGWSESLEGLRSATISFSAMYADDATYGTNALFTALSNRTQLSVVFGTDVAGNDEWTATAYLTSLEISSPAAEETVTFSGTAQITGAVTSADTV